MTAEARKEIVKRLRALSHEHYEMLGDIHIPLTEAADEIERLNGTLSACLQEAARHHAEDVKRAEWSGSDMAQRKAKAIVSRSGVLLHNLRAIARASWEGNE